VLSGHLFGLRHGGCIADVIAFTANLQSVYFSNASDVPGIAARKVYALEAAADRYLASFSIFYPWMTLCTIYAMNMAEVAAAVLLRVEVLLMRQVVVEFSSKLQTNQPPYPLESGITFLHPFTGGRICHAAACCRDSPRHGAQKCAAGR
jgi:hypothetical protein